MSHPQPLRFVRDLRALDDALTQAKLVACPNCHRAGMLVGHGLLFGYAERSGDLEIRGRRLLCSGRFRRSGCGLTFSVLLATVIAGFTVRTGTLSRFLEAVVGGQCRRMAWEQNSAPGLSLRSGYRLWARLVAAQPRLRTSLCTVGPPPASTGEHRRATDRPDARSPSTRARCHRVCLRRVPTRIRARPVRLTNRARDPLAIGNRARA